MHVIEWTIIETLSVSTSNFFEVPCSIQKVVKFKGRINVQLPIVDALVLSLTTFVQKGSATRAFEPEVPQVLSGAISARSQHCCEKAASDRLGTERHLSRTKRQGGRRRNKLF